MISDKHVGNDSDILACAAKNGITGNRQCVNKSMLSSIGFSEIRLQFMVFIGLSSAVAHGILSLSSERPSFFVFQSCMLFVDFSFLTILE